MQTLDEIINNMGKNNSDKLDLPKEIERKYLIKKPTKEKLENFAGISSDIVQIYLQKNNPETERRIRLKDTNDTLQYFYTEKTDLSFGERIEEEKIISADEYLKLLKEADMSLHPIVKNRTTFEYENNTFELDIYALYSDFAIIEIELKDINQEIIFPDIEIVKEVTNDKRYSNNSLAQMSTQEMQSLFKNSNEITL